MPLADLSFLQSQLGVTGDTTRWLSCLSAANALAVRILGYDPLTTAYTEYLDGTGTNELVLPVVRNVTAVTTVKLDATGGRGQVPDSFGALTVLTQGVDYIADLGRGVLERWYNGTASGGYGWFWGQTRGPTNYWRGLSTGGATQPFWPRVRGCVYVAWTAGWAVAPDDLRGAVVQLAAWLFNNQEMGGLIPGSVSYIDTSASLAAAADLVAGGQVAALGHARAVLYGYREHPLAGGIR